MNLNTFGRHGVFEDRQSTRLIMERLRDPAQIQKAKVFPYQLLAAYLNAGEAVPTLVTEALIDAAEIAVANVPVIEGRVFVFPDVGLDALAGDRAPRAADVEDALRSTSLDWWPLALRRNPEAEIMPFEAMS
jgi:60 kDa SS-A/Ro ribonucleoprotein